MSSKRRALQRAKRRALVGTGVASLSAAAAGSAGFSQMPTPLQGLFLLLAVLTTGWTSWQSSKPPGLGWSDAKKKVSFG
jgi:hypothetical protein